VRIGIPRVGFPEEQPQSHGGKFVVGVTSAFFFQHTDGSVSVRRVVEGKISHCAPSKRCGRDTAQINTLKQALGRTSGSCRLNDIRLHKKRGLEV